MDEKRTKNAKKNIATTFIDQIVATICGVLVPHIMINVFGSALYGITTSVSQFLSYISLLEGGVGRVARAELYKPLAKKDKEGIGKVYYATKRFFFSIGVAFIIYTLILSLTYYDIADVEIVDRKTVFILIWIISLSVLAKYLGGLANLTLINASQRQYISNTIVTVTTILNTVLIVVIAIASKNVLAVKLGSSLVFIARPVLYSLYVKKHYEISNVINDKSVLKQKWTGIGQHLAYFLHTNTDIVLLTLFADIRLVAVYSVYSLIITNIRKIASSCVGGMEAVLGEMIAKNEHTTLQKSYRQYQFLLSNVSTVLFGTTAILIIPFVRLYTQGITDANYIQPAFAFILLFAESVDCLMQPCSNLVISANKLKETRWGSYGEAIINISLSCILIHWNPLVGIAIGTLSATLFKGIFYMIYAANHILKLKVRQLIKDFLFTNVLIGCITIVGILFIDENMIANFWQWIICGIVVVCAVSLITVLVNALFYSAELRALMQLISFKVHKNKSAEQ